MIPNIFDAIFGMQYLIHHIVVGDVEALHGTGDKSLNNLT